MEYALIVGLIGAIAIVAVVAAGSNVSRLLNRTANSLAGVGNTTSTSGSSGTSTGSTTPASCAAIKTETPSLSGLSVRTIRVGSTDFQALCDFSTYGGGWTLVVAQFEGDPVLNWNEGRQSDYDPTLATSRGFALSTAQIPAHTQTAFGRVQSGFSAVMIDAIAAPYSTGDIALRSYPGINTPTTEYWRHRSATGYYGCHDPDSPAGCGGLGNDPNWNNTLTFNTVTPGTFAHTWAFSPNNITPMARGYAFNGGLSSSPETYAWGVWVR